MRRSVATDATVARSSTRDRARRFGVGAAWLRRRSAALLVAGSCLAMSPVAGNGPPTASDAVATGPAGDAHFDVAERHDIAGRGDGGAWSIAGSRVASVTRDGETRSQAELAALGFGNPVHMAVDGYDDGAWIATDASLLLHFSADGRLDRGTTLPGVASALAVDLDQSIWLIVLGELMHFERGGVWLETRDLRLAAGETVTALAPDSLRDRLWIATDVRIAHVATSRGASRSLQESLRGQTAALAVDPRSGSVLAIVDGHLAALDADGLQRSFDEAGLQNERPLAVLYDGDDGSFVARTTASVLRLSAEGLLRDIEPASATNVIAVAPFRLEPTLALVRPPDGGAITDPHTDTVLVVGAACNGKPCDVREGYLESIGVTASLDGVALGNAVVDPASRRATFAQRAPLRNGTHRLSARAADRFGHRTSIDGARWSLLEAAPDPVAAQPAPRSGAPSTSAPVKAANKPPAVALSSPANGATFTAGASITLAATATDPDGTIAKVEFYRGGSTLLGASATAPYQFAWTNVPAGSYALTAKAYDNRNGTATSAPVTISVANNRLPVVTLTSPVGGAFLAAGSRVTLDATASDPDGAIARVEFFDGAISIGTAAVLPYVATWEARDAGLHVISARAIDDKGGASDSAPVDIVVGAAPVVVVTAPVACAVVDGPVDLTLTADAVSAGGRIVKVDFFDGAAPIASASDAPWRATLVNASAGSHSITAKATDDHGLTKTSRPASVTVRAANQPPSVALTAPSEGARFPVGASIGLTASAADVDGSVAAVEFRIGTAGGALIARATNAPYAAAWSGMLPGSYALVAVAFDDRGAATTSSAVNVTIDANALPSVVLTAPAPDAGFTAPASVAVAAAATDSDGTIAKVEFYAGAQLVATATAAPFAATWTNVGAGSYSITAKATDNLGGVAVSAPVSIIVASNAAPSVVLTAPTAGSQYFAPGTIAVTASATDGDGAIARVEFYANGALLGSSAAPPYRFVWDPVAAGSYLLTARAIDDRAAATTSAGVGVTVAGGPAIGISATLDGAAIDDDNVTVAGFVSAPGNSTVTVGGVVTHIDDFGRFQANAVPLAPGANVVTAAVTTQDGQTSSESVTITSTGRGAFVVRASPTEGLNSLQVTFTVENPGGVPFRQIDLDLDNDGFPNVIATPDQFVEGILTVQAAYPVGTWLATVEAYDDQDRVIYATSKSIVVLSPDLLAGTLRAVYDGMLLRLKSGNIAGALTAFTGAAYAKYQAIFAQLQPNLAAIVDQLGEVREMSFGSDLAELSVVRDTPDGPRRFMLYLIRAEDGIWRIDGM